MIEIKNVEKKFGNKQVLNNVSIKIDNGIYGLLGPNGAGKTTLFRCMMNLYSMSGGEITMDGVPLKRNKKISIGYLPQSFGLFKELNVMDAMKYFCNIKKVPRKGRDEEIARCIYAVNLEEHLKENGRKLSGGMIRRVGVAQALLNRPQIILFDEPTAGLDPEERMRFKNVISHLGKEETVIISTHIVEDVEACCEKVIVMNEGKIVCMKKCSELVDDARGKVYSCQKEKLEQIPCEYVVEKQFERDSTVYYRVLVNDRNGLGDGYFEEQPTIEDGYLVNIRWER